MHRNSVKAIDRQLALCLVFFLGTFLFGISANAGQTLTIVYPEFYPFFEQGEDGNPRGFFYDIITQALDERMQVPTQWQVLPWKRCQAYVKSGRADAMITVPTKERGQYSETHKTPFYLKGLTIFTHKYHPKMEEILAIQSIEDIRKGGFSVITYGGNGWHKKNIASHGIPGFEVPNFSLVWRMLAAQRGDLVIEWPVVAYVGMEEMGVSDKIIGTGVSLKTMPFHLLISRKSEFIKILPRFDQTITKMHADGTMDKIIAAYY